MASPISNAVVRRRGRPKADATRDLSNPHYVRFMAALRLEEAVYDLFLQARGGQTGDSTFLRVTAENVASDLGCAPAIVLRNVSTLQQRMTKQPFSTSQKAAGEETGGLVGKGSTWFRDLFRTADPSWIPFKRRRTSTESSRKTKQQHPGRFDRLTRSERCFYEQIPPEARAPIERAVRELVSRPLDTSASRRIPFDLDSSLYLYDIDDGIPGKPSTGRMRQAGDRDKLPPPPALRKVVQATIAELPPKIGRATKRAMMRQKSDGGAFAILPLPALGPPQPRLTATKRRTRRSSKPNSTSMWADGSAQGHRVAPNSSVISQLKRILISPLSLSLFGTKAIAAGLSQREVAAALAQGLKKGVFVLTKNRIRLATP